MEGCLGVAEIERASSARSRTNKAGGNAMQEIQAQTKCTRDHPKHLSNLCRLASDIHGNGKNAPAAYLIRSCLQMSRTQVNLHAAMPKWLHSAGRGHAYASRHSIPAVDLNTSKHNSIATLCYAMLRYATLCYAMLCYAILCYAMQCNAMLCYAALCHTMSCCAMLCHAMLCHAMLYYALHGRDHELCSVSTYASSAAGTAVATDRLIMTGQ